MNEIEVDDEPVTVKFRGDVRLTLFPLPLKHLKKLRTHTARIKEGDDVDDARLDAIIDAITASAQIGDATVTREKVEDLITVNNAAKVMQALMGVSGMNKSQGGDGNGPPALAPSTGADSTPVSSPSQDGPGQPLMN